MAAGAVGIAIYALDVAREAKSAAAPAAAPTAPSLDATPRSSPPATPASSPSPNPTTPPPPVLLAEIVTAERRLPPAENCNATYVDVDTLAIGQAAGHEFYLSSCLGPIALRVDRKENAAPTSPDPSPDECAAQLAGVSAGPELVLPVREGLTFCLLTSRADAVSQGIPQRLAIVEVVAVNLDGSVTIEVSTYRVVLPV